jgi:hypothetical protein
MVATTPRVCRGGVPRLQVSVLEPNTPDRVQVGEEETRTQI